MTYQVLARKWRPQNFQELVGQEKVLAALIHGLSENRLHHAYLFTGTRGVGKTTVARILAKSLNCEQGISAIPCGNCETCIEIRDGRFIDLIEIDAASRTKVEDTRELLDNIQYAPAKGRFKVYLIDEVHMLSTHSFNALLKTLEEPPEHVKFLLATTDPQKLPITVLSRCLQFHLKNIPVERIIERLKNILTAENIQFDEEALLAIAKTAEGSLRDALSLTDQAIGQGEGRVQAATTLHMLGVVRTELLYQLASALTTQDHQRLEELLAIISDEPVDYSTLLKLFAEFWYEVSLQQTFANYKSSNWDQNSLTECAKALSPSLVQLFYDMAIQGKKDLPFAPEPQIGFNMTLLRMLAFRPMTMTAAAIPAPTKLEVKAPVAAPIPATVAAAPAKNNDLVKIPLEDWENLLNTLPLAGMMKQIIKNTSFERCENNILILSIANNHQSLFNDGVKNKLTELLQNYYERPFTLQILSSETPVASPAAKAEQVRQAQESQLQEKLNLDPNIDFIKNNFNGRISSVKST